MVEKHINNIKKIEKRMHDNPQFHKENPLALLSFIELFYYFMNTKHLYGGYSLQFYCKIEKIK